MSMVFCGANACWEQREEAKCYKEQSVPGMCCREQRVAFWQYMNFMWLCSGPDLVKWNALKDQSIYIPMTMLVLLNKVIQWHCIQKNENESPLFQPQTEDSLLHSKQSPYITLLLGLVDWLEYVFRDVSQWLLFISSKCMIWKFPI